MAEHGYLVSYVYSLTDRSHSIESCSPEFFFFRYVIKQKPFNMNFPNSKANQSGFLLHPFYNGKHIIYSLIVHTIGCLHEHKWEEGKRHSIIQIELLHFAFLLTKHYSSSAVIIIWTDWSKMYYQNNVCIWNNRH